MLRSTRASLSALVVDSIQWSSLSEPERVGARWLVYQQSDDIALVGVFDSAGQGIGNSLYRDDQSVADLAAHPKISAADLDAFTQTVPFASAQKDGFAVGAVRAARGGGPPLVPIAFSTPGTKVEEPWVVAIYLSLQGPCKALGRGNPSGTSIIMVGADGTILCSEDTEALGTRVSTTLLEGLNGESDWSYQEESGDAYFVAKATTEAGWHVLVHEERAQVVAPGRRIMYQMLFWFAIGLIGALVAGMILARGINRPISVLTDGAKALESGDLEHRIPLSGNDEFGRLSKSFNAMADQIADWNRTLRDRVDEQTRDLKETQELLVESKKQAAVATMGAGIAHEINNPLTGVLSMVQIAKNKAAKSEGQEKVVKMLEKADHEARRIRDIVQRMHALSQAGEASREDISLRDVLDESLSSMSDDLVAADVDVLDEVSGDAATVFGVRAEIQEALTEIIRNSTRAMASADERKLTLRTEVVGKGLVSLDISDTGCGIAEDDIEKVFEPFFTAKDNWNSKGLGLSVVQRIITDHQGTIRIRSAENAGATVHIVLPTKTKRAHLE
jgi:signal transduction histidine kinase